MSNENKQQKPNCPLIGEDGNIFNLVGIAARTLKRNGLSEQASEMTEKVFGSGSYEEALGIIGDYVNITSVDDPGEDSLGYIRELRALGIAVISEKENINTLTAESEMLITIMSCFAQAESESISKNVSWGVRQSFKNGNVPMQYARMLGYRKGHDGNAEIIPEEAEVVKEIYRCYLDGMSMNLIADRLNEKGLTTKGGSSPYRKTVVQRILTNEKYTGDALLQKTYVTDCITKKTRKNNGELPMYLVKNHHEPIISRSDYNRVQEEMARRSAKRTIADKLTKTGQGKYSAKYALSELLICGECGEHYRRVTWTAKGFKELWLYKTSSTPDFIFRRTRTWEI